MTQSGDTKSVNEWVLGIERFIVFAIVTFGAQVTIGGQALDLSSASGRAAAISAVVTALYVVARKQLFGN